MRTLFVLLFGIVIGAVALYYYENQPRLGAHGSTVTGNAAASSREAAQDLANRGRSFASGVSDSISGKMRDWHLTGPDIHADLDKTGQVVRENAARAKERVADVRIISVIKAKYVLDRDLSARTIDVESHDGDVLLTGTVPAEDLIGRAVAAALDTEGVHHVTSKLTVAK